jgi:sulfhydrogenase subunit alpha
MATRKLVVDYLARVEGEGAMTVDIKGDKVTDVKLRIFEPPRFYEAFLQGRKYTEAPDITARICGICPVAYIMSACHAMEDILGIKVEGQLRALRRLIYCGEWIKSHALHMFMLHLPDFLGYPDAIHMAKDHKDLVETALRLKKIGNHITTVVGGRDVHPINTRVGGFYRVPKKQELEALIPDLKWGLETSIKVIDILLSVINFPEFEQDYTYLALDGPHEYPYNEGNLITNLGLDVPISEFSEVMVEEHVKRSTSLHTSLRKDGVCLVGPAARLALNFKKLTPKALEIGKKLGFEKGCNNPFKSILVRGIENIFAFEDALNIIADYKRPSEPYVSAKPREGTGYGCTEAPRGICHHTYTIDNDGIIQKANIAPPTSINQGRIEKDLLHFTQQNIAANDDELRNLCETVIRNYDPCISCSVHFLDLTVNRT